MKLLFDQNLSFKLCDTLADLFPESNHVGVSGLSQADDRDVWDYAKAHGFTIVSQDVDFAEMAAV
jgi:predicted nuclease of predicted toxin-antitoxin system